MIRAHRFQLNALSLASGRLRLKHGDVIEQAPGFERLHPKGVFTDLGQGERLLQPRMPWWAGIGDKVYAIPSLYHAPGQTPQTRMWIDARDAPIYRTVRDSVHVGPGEADFINVLDTEAPKELTDEIAERLGVEPLMKLPVMETTETEKRLTVKTYQQRERPYVCAAPWSSDPKRSVRELKCWAERYLPEMGYDYEWYVSASAHDKLATYMQLIDGAEFVISVGTSAIPLAGALQVPVVSLVPYRSGYFLDERVTTMTGLRETVEELIGKIDWDRCWCGATGGKRSVIANTYIVECSTCGTCRQHVRVTQGGLARFYDRYYDVWRQVIEGERSYDDAAKIEKDTATARKRIAQWGHQKGERWLDVGCGSGALIRELRALTVEATGVKDGSRPRGKFNTISYVDVLEHLRDPLAELRRMARRLKPGGRIIVALPMAWHNGGEPKHIRRLQHIWLWTEETFGLVAERAGLTIKRIIRPVKGRAAFELMTT